MSFLPRLRARATGTMGCGFAAGLALAISLTACGQGEVSQGAAEPPLVTVALPVQRTITEWNEHSGRLAAVETAQVRPRVTGFVDRIHFTEGSLVTQGQRLVSLDHRTFKADLAAAEAEVEQARVQLELAKGELGRVEALIGSRAVSQEEVERRQRQVQTVEAEVAAAEAEMATIRLDLEFTQVTAPISGRVGRAEVTAGNLVTGGSGTSTVLTSIVSLDPIYVYFTPDEHSALDYLRRQRAAGEDKVTVEMAVEGDEGFPHIGYLDFIDNQLDAATGTLLVRALFDNPDGLLLPGLFARLRLPAGPASQVLLVPEAAIILDQTWEILMLVDTDNVVQRRRVETGSTVDGMTVIRNGLAAGERVVVEGTQRARPGSLVTPELQVPGTSPTGTSSTGSEPATPQVPGTSNAGTSNTDPQVPDPQVPGTSTTGTSTTDPQVPGTSPTTADNAGPAA